LGFAGTKKEAEEIRDKLSEFLGQKLKLSLSSSKTLITHAVDGKAKFLGYEVTVSRSSDKLMNGGRYANGVICFLMPVDVVKNIESANRRNGKVIHRSAMLHDSDYTIVQRFQAVFRGIYNYFCLASNISLRMGRIRWTLEQSLVKTLAGKSRTKVCVIYKRYRSISPDGLKQLQVVIKRDGKKPLVATFAGFHINRVRKAATLPDFSIRRAWFNFGNRRSEVVNRLLSDKCEICGKRGDMEVHHIRKLSDIDRPGRRPRTVSERIMSARRRKTLVVCVDCHREIHAGQYDGPSFR